MLPINTLAKEIMEEQVSNGWPGLVNEAVVISENLDIPGLLDPLVTKKSFKRFVKDAIKDDNDISVF